MKARLACWSLFVATACSSKSSTTETVADAQPEEVQTSPPAEFIPAVTGTCPEFTTGTQSFTPDGKARNVMIWASDKAKTLDGPLVFFWHGNGGDPSEAPAALGDALQTIVDMGGIVAAPFHDPYYTSLPWALCLGGTDERDLRLADEVLACARAKVGVDMRHIHSVGFSAGAMNTEQFASRRSGYLASIVAYSGAHIGGPDEQDPLNKYPAMLFFGGPKDVVIVNFSDATAAYHDELTAAGQFSIVCDHGQGHTVPAAARASAWQFLNDHPFGTRPEPYQNGLPAGFPTYCTL